MIRDSYPIVRNPIRELCVISKARLLVCFLAFFSFILHSATAVALDPGEPAPDFALPSYDGKTVELSDLKGKIVVLEWFNSGCPFVMKHYRSGHMQKLQNEYTAKGVSWLTINSTNQKHKDFLTPEKAMTFMKEHKVSSPTFLVDMDGKVGKTYGAKTTPHIFVIDKSGLLAYAGAIDDDSDTGSNPAEAKNYLELALSALLDGTKPQLAKTSPYGCGVKYAS